MTSSANIAGRIKHGADVPGCDCYLLIAGEATAHGIAQASTKLLNAWAADIRQKAQNVPEAASYWETIAANLEQMALEKESGVRV
jgi:hypothetical protein